MYERIAAYVASNYWALEASKFEAMMDVLRFRMAGGRLTPEEIRARVEAAGGRADGPLERYVAPAGDATFQAVEDGTPFVALDPAARQGRQTVAVIGVYGILAHRAGGLNEMSGGASTERVSAAVRAAANDASVKGIVLDVNSPGGAVQGVSELAAEIRAARALKPVEAVANANAQSGGYWVLSAASYASAIPSALLGAIGVFSARLDESKAREMRGEALEIITDDVLSKHKAEGVAGPMPPEGKDHERTLVNAFANLFGRDVSAGRGVSIETVRREFGQGRSLDARRALAAKMIDSIGSLDDAIRRVARGTTPQRELVPAAEVEGGTIMAVGEPGPDIAAPTAEQIAAAARLGVL